MEEDRALSILSHINPSIFYNIENENIEKSLRLLKYKILEKREGIYNLLAENRENSLQTVDCVGLNIEPKVSTLEWLLDKALDPKGFLIASVSGLALSFIYSGVNPLNSLASSWPYLVQTGIAILLILRHKDDPKSWKSKVLLYAASVLVQLYTMVRQSKASDSPVTLSSILLNTTLGPFLPIVKYFISWLHPSFLKSIFLFGFLVVKRVAIVSFVSIAIIGSLLILLVFIGDRINEGADAGKYSKKSFVDVSYEKQFE
eukprot:TRINITY_DN16555_c0_g1_i1.p1 TRINITY_DN16555_c0_g1~~TRINITY_DN16555_c0_g1_i1.p1  ORF type:complete len:259 (+),score=55.61 TRINITY_DN16555_c0_g1_i1:83-859(+)